MGACGSKLTPEQREQRARSKALERRMSIDNMSEEQKIKLLLLGAGESGKSTIFKQMRILYGDEMKDDERKNFVKVVHGNCIGSMKLAMESAPHLGAKIADEESANALKGIDTYSTLSSEIASAVKSLWKDPAIVKVFENKSKFQLTDSAEYWFDAIDRISDPAYIPTVQRATNACANFRYS